MASHVYMMFRTYLYKVDDVSAASADEALAVVKDMARRGGGRLGKAVTIRTEDVERVAKGY